MGSEHSEGGEIAGKGRRQVGLGAAVEIDLPAERQYAETMERPEFIKVANRVRDLLGSTSAAD